MALVGIIGGSGVVGPSLENAREVAVETPYGRSLITVGEFSQAEVAFLHRHGRSNRIPPHMINYRANIWGLKCLGVRCIVSTAAVGSLKVAIRPGTWVLVDQFLDFTGAGPTTFLGAQEAEIGADPEDKDSWPVWSRMHVDFTNPYCKELGRLILAVCREMGRPILRGGCYVSVAGPRYETSAETRMYRSLGGDVIGMTGAPEVILSRELGICFSTLAIVTNYSAGIASSSLSHSEVEAFMLRASDELRPFFSRLLEELSGEWNCDCSR